MPKTIRHWIRLVWKKCPVSAPHLTFYTKKKMRVYLATQFIVSSLILQAMSGLDQFKLQTGFATMYKGNLISKCLYGVIVWTKKLKILQYLRIFVLEVWFYMNGPSKLHAAISSKPFQKKMYSFCSNQLNLSKYTWLEH